MCQILRTKFLCSNFGWSYSCEVHHLLAADLSGGFKKPGKRAISFSCCPHHLSSLPPAFHKSLFLSPQFHLLCIEVNRMLGMRTLISRNICIYILGGPFLNAITSLKTYPARSSKPTCWVNEVYLGTLGIDLR